MGKASENKLNFTKTGLLNLPAPARQTYYWDTKIEGLGLGVTPNGTKTFILYRRLNGKPVRLKLGRFPVMTVEQAKTAAIMSRDGRYAGAPGRLRAGQPAR